MLLEPAGRRGGVSSAPTSQASRWRHGDLVELLFGGFGLVHDQGNASIMQERISWNYTTWLNIAFLPLAVALLIRFL
ncbi:MAG: hypothetical protein JWO11_1936 [Nocardioides sp.]|nr:hypothetical protein [Nocardioides sp.]